ncbi:MAG: ATP-binding protein [Planctomycetota bacterium]
MQRASTAIAARAFGRSIGVALAVSVVGAVAVAVAGAWSLWAPEELAPKDVVVGALGTVGGGALMLATVLARRVRKGLRPLLAIDSALQAYSKGERRSEALGVMPGFGPRALAWNAILTERTEAEAEAIAALARSELADEPVSGSPAQSAFEGLPHGVVVLDNRLMVQHANGAAGVLLRRDRSEFAGKLLSELFEDEAVLAGAQRVIEGQSRARTVELEDNEGSARSVLAVSVRSIRRKGEPPMAVVLIEDVTQQRIADEARGVLLAQTTHELRTPLTNIRLYVEEALDAGEEDPLLRARALDVIQGEVRRLERIVGDMLSASEIEAGELTLRVAEVRLATVFDDLQSEYRPQAEERRIELKVDLPPKWPVAWADREKLVLSLHNLVGNAMKYTPSGGSVRVDVDADEEELRVSVADTGIGIAAEECERVFDRFYRAENGRESGEVGSGLGLAMAREVARLHGGDITLESEVGVGSTFSMVIPIVRRDRRAAA